MKTVTFELPDDLAEMAEEDGLLAPDAFAKILEEALRRKAGRRLRETAKGLHAANFPPMTMDEIQEIVNEVRAEMRRKRSQG